MDNIITAWPFTVAMFGGMLLCLELGRIIGTRALARDPQLMSTHGSVDGAIFALYGLLLAFTFSGAPNRLDTRRQLIADEANAIGTAYSRVDLLAPQSQIGMREQFRRYLDLRLSAYRKLPNIAAAKEDLSRAASVYAEIWSQAVAATRLADGHSEAGKLLLPSLNEMNDVATKRTMATRIHPPPIIFGLLFLLALVCSLLAGFAMAVSKHRSWLHMIAFAMIAVITVFVVLEIEYPRVGLLSVETQYDHVLVELRESMR